MLALLLLVAAAHRWWCGWLLGTSRARNIFTIADVVRVAAAVVVERIDRAQFPPKCRA